MNSETPYVWAYHHVERDHTILYQGYDGEKARAIFDQAVEQAMQSGDTLHISYDVHFSRHRLSLQQAIQARTDLIARERSATTSRI